MAQIKSRRSGSWDDPKTWAGGRVPRDGDTVIIRSGTVVTPSSKSHLRGGSIQIEDGAVFDITKTRLKLGLRGMSGGGTPSQSGGGGIGITRED